MKDYKRVLLLIIGFVIINSFLFAQDYYYDQGKQWNLDSINIQDAWSITTGNSNIKIAVLGNGLDMEHEDLENNIVPGYNVWDQNTQTDHQYDDEWHETVIAGIIGAEANNNVGIRGIAYNCKIMPILFTKTDGAFLYENMALAIEKAVDLDADILNISYGSKIIDDDDKELINESIDYAINNGRSGKGCIIVGAAGNTDNTLTFPARTNNVIAVGAIDQDNKRLSDSGKGEELDLTAPGKVYSLDPEGYRGKNNGNYQEPAKFCTSYSTPHVSGVAALMLSANNTLMHTEVKKILYMTAKNLGKGGWDSKTGWGRVDAGKAVKTAAQQFTTNGQITCNEFWWGNIELTNDVTVSSGDTLRVWNDATINMTNGSQLIIEDGGRLEIDAGVDIDFGSNSEILVQGEFVCGDAMGSWVNLNFTGKTGGIIIDNAHPPNNLYFSHTNISNANVGIKVLNTSYLPDIESCVFENNNTGIQISNCGSLNSAYSIFSCNFINNSNYGIYAYNSTVKAAQCDIDGSGSGIYAYSSSIKLADNYIHNCTYGVNGASGSNILMNTYSDYVTPPDINNKIFNNSTGVFLAPYSDGNLGEDNSPYGTGENGFYNSSMDIVKTVSPTIKAESNRWTQNPLVSGNVDILPVSSEPLFKSISNSKYEYLFSTIETHIKDSLYTEALDILKDLNNDILEDSLIVKSLLNMKRIYNLMERESDYLNYLDKMYQTDPNTLAGKIAYRFSLSPLLHAGEYEEVLNRISQLIIMYSTDESWKDENIAWLLFERLVVYLELDRGLAKSTEAQFNNDLAILMTQYSGTDAAKNAEVVFNTSGMVFPETELVVIPEKFALHNAYPNPFNPSTTIPFSLTEQSTVTIKVYDLNGKEVWSLGNNLEYGIGKHQVVWNAVDASGTPLSTGVYFIKLSVGNQIATQKVILMK